MIISIMLVDPDAQVITLQMPAGTFPTIAVNGVQLLVEGVATDQVDPSQPRTGNVVDLRISVGDLVHIVQHNQANVVVMNMQFFRTPAGIFYVNSDGTLGRSVVEPS